MNWCLLCHRNGALQCLSYLEGANNAIPSLFFSFSSFDHRTSYGDKDTYRLAFHLAGRAAEFQQASAEMQTTCAAQPLQGMDARPVLRRGRQPCMLWDMREPCDCRERNSTLQLLQVPHGGAPLYDGLKWKVSMRNAYKDLPQLPCCTLL